MMPAAKRLDRAIRLMKELQQVERSVLLIRDELKREIIEARAAVLVEEGCAVDTPSSRIPART